ncbi:aldehyde dehydrogenase family protein [Leucobacter allii]|uniref:aldehyde dehydrogenase family protein n=1 Tax=Leucobacter allii TaxID=2932247 RepID=UPI003211C5DB
MRLFAGIAMELKGSTISASSGLHVTVREPIGVVVRVVPFNHPTARSGACTSWSRSRGRRCCRRRGSRAAIWPRRSGTC